MGLYDRFTFSKIFIVDLKIKRFLPLLSQFDMLKMWKDGGKLMIVLEYWVIRGMLNNACFKKFYQIL